MIKVTHLSIHTETEPILDDISFTLANQGFVSFCAEPLACHFMAHYFGALQAPLLGEIWFDNLQLTNQKSIQSTLRSTYVQGLFTDFQLLLNKSVYDNVTLGLPYNKNQIDELLKEWKLDKKKFLALEDLEFIDQARTVIVRCLLRNPRLLVFDASTSCFSNKEKDQLYQLLKKCSDQLLIVVCGDKNASHYADHILECRKTRLVSDNLCENVKQIAISKENFRLPSEKRKSIKKEMNRRLKWKLRILFLCLIISAVAINVVLFNDRLHLTDLETAVLTSAGQNVIEIDKQAVGDDGTLYTNRYDTLDDVDKQNLEEKLKDHLFYSYQAENKEQEVYYQYGVTNFKRFAEYYDAKEQFDILELNDETDMDFKNIIGYYPTAYNEVCISDIYANQLLSDGQFSWLENPSVEDVIGQTLKWYGSVLTITGIIPYAENPNLSIQTKKIENNVIDTEQLYVHHLFVKKGFIENHSIATHLAFPDLYTQVQIDNYRIQLNDLRMINDEYYFYDGIEFEMINYLAPGECLLDENVIYQLVYKDRYPEIMADETLSVSDRNADYYKYASQLIGKQLDVEAFHIQNAGDNSMVMQKTLTVKGVLPPSELFLEDYFQYRRNGQLIMSEADLQPYLKQNYKVAGVFYQNSNLTEMREALNYLDAHPYYQAFVSNSRMFQVFVVDIKDLRGVLLFIGCLFLVLYVSGFLYLLDRNRSTNKKEMTILYLFGEWRSHLEWLYVKNAIWKLLKYNSIAALISLVGIYILVFFISYDFDSGAAISILSYVSIPLYFLLVVLVLMSLFTFLFIRWRCVIDPYFQHPKNMLK